MKHIFKLMTVAALLAVTVSGCSEREMMGGNGTTDPAGNAVGYVRIADGGLTVEFDGERVNNPEQGSRAEATAPAGANVDDFWVEFISTETNEPVEYTVGDSTDTRFTYAQVKGAKVYVDEEEYNVIALKPGNYILRAYSGDAYDKTAGVYWDGETPGQPSWAGESTPFEITIEHTAETPKTGVNVQCALQSVKVTVVLDHGLAEHLKDGTEVNVIMTEDLTDLEEQTLTATYTNVEHPYGLADIKISDAGQFTGVDNETRPSAVSYFVPDAVNNAMTVVITGMYNDGKEDRQFSAEVEISDGDEDPVIAGQWRKIWLYLEAEDEPEGSIVIKAVVETWVYDEQIDVDVTNVVASVGERTIKDTDESKLSIYSSNGGMKLDGTPNEISSFDAAGKFTGNAKLGLRLNTGKDVSKFAVKIKTNNSEIQDALTEAKINDEWVDIATISGSAKVFFNSWGLPTTVPTGNVEYDLASFIEYAYTCGDGIHIITFAVESGDYTYNAVLTLDVNANGGSDVPSDGEPTIVWRGGKDFETRYTVSNNLQVIIDITVPAGIKNLFVTMSGALESELEGLMPTHFDLANTSAAEFDGDLKETLRGHPMYFPTDDQVVGEKSLVFDISTFMPMLSVIEGDSDFMLEVVDANGLSDKKTIKLHVEVTE